VKRPSGKEWPRLLWQVINKFFEDGGPSMAASLSYYTFFSLPALLLILLLLLGTFLDPEDVRGAILAQIQALVGVAGAEQVKTILTQADRPEGGFGATTLLSVGVLAFGATTAFGELQTALNRTWAVEPDPRRGTLRNFLVKRVFSFGLVLVIAFLLLVSLVVSAALAGMGEGMAGLMPGDLSERVLAGVGLALSFAVFAALFAAMFKLIPDADIEWRDVWPGAVGTATLFVLGKWLLGLYLGETNPGEAYGAAGSLAVLMIWVYYSSMILLFGAEVTRVWADRYGSGVHPTAGAVEVVQEKRPVKSGPEPG